MPISMFNPEEEDLDPSMSLYQKIASAGSVNPRLKELAAQKITPPQAPAEPAPAVDPYSLEARQKLVDQNNSYDTKGAITGALASLAAGFQGGNSMDAVGRVMNQRADQRKSSLEEFDKGKVAQRDGEREKRESDPNSQESKMATELALSMGYKGGPITAKQFKEFSPVMQAKYEIEQRKLDRAEARDERRFQHGIKVEEKKERQVEQDVQKLSKDVEGVQDLIGGLDEVERELGGKLEEFSKDKNGNLTKAGKAVDLPGVSIPGIGRVSAYDTAARNLQSAAARVFNATLKDRSGGSVTDNEMERLRQEFNAGKYNTEPELIAALQRYKRQTNIVMKNREAAYNKDVVNKYADQGGRTSKPIAPEGKTIVKKFKGSGGSTKVVYNDGTEEIIPNMAGN